MTGSSDRRGGVIGVFPGSRSHGMQGFASTPRALPWRMDHVMHSTTTSSFRIMHCGSGADTNACTLRAQRLPAVGSFPVSGFCMTTKHDRKGESNTRLTVEGVRAGLLLLQRNKRKQTKFPPCQIVAAKFEG